MIVGAALLGWADRMPFHLDPEAARKISQDYAAASCAELEGAYLKLRSLRSLRWPVHDLGVGLVMAGLGGLAACILLRLRRWADFGALPTPRSRAAFVALSSLCWFMLSVAMGQDAFTDISRDEVLSGNCVEDGDLHAAFGGMVALIVATPLVTVTSWWRARSATFPASDRIRKQSAMSLAISSCIAILLVMAITYGSSTVIPLMLWLYLTHALRAA